MERASCLLHTVSALCVLFCCNSLPNSDANKWVVGLWRGIVMVLGATVHFLILFAIIKGVSVDSSTASEHSLRSVSGGVNGRIVLLMQVLLS